MIGLSCAGLVALAGLPAASAVVHGVVLADSWPIATASGVLGLATIAVWIGVWAFSGRTWPAYVALALVPCWAMAELGASPAGGINHRSAGAIAALVPAVVALVLFDRAHRMPAIDTTLRPLRSVGLMLCGAAVALTGFVIGAQAAGDASYAAVGAVGGVAAALWGVAANIARRCGDMRVGDRQRMVLGLLAFAFATGDRTVGILYPSGELGSWAFLCGRAVAFIGWALLFAVALHSLARARAFASGRQRDLRVARDEVVRGSAQDRRRFDEARHDLRSLVAGIHGASATLARYRDFLGARERFELESAMIAELARLRHALSSVQASADQFMLREAIEPVITAERACGAVIRTDLVDVRVQGAADAVAALVQNLVTNARRHAPGAAITITTEIEEDAVLLVVADAGPGLPDAIRRRVATLFRDNSGAEGGLIPRQSPGSPEAESVDPSPGDTSRRGGGLGLAICARLAAEQGGRLRLLDSAVGTHIELSLRHGGRHEEQPQHSGDMQFSGVR